MLSDPPSYNGGQAQQCALIRWEVVKAQLRGLRCPQITAIPALAACHISLISNVPPHHSAIQNFIQMPADRLHTCDTCPEMLNHTEHIVSALAPSMGLSNPYSG